MRKWSSKIDVMSTNKSSDITVPHADRRERRNSIVVLDRSKYKLEKDVIELESDATINSVGVLASHDNFCKNIQPEENSRESSSVTSEKSKIQQTFGVEEPPKMKRIEGLFVKISSEITKEGSSAVEIEKSKFEGASATNLGVWKMRVAEGPSAESLSGIKKRKTKGSLRNSLKRKVDLIERILEDQVERIWEENVEKHTWLQPIETWIVDRCRPSNYTLTHCQSIDASNNSTDINEGPMSKSTYDFKFTQAMGENEESKIEMILKDRRAVKVDESKIESKMTEQWRRLRNRAVSPKSDRFETASSITQLNKQDIDSPHVGSEVENPSVLNDSGVLEVKEIKRHDLLDKLKDNVKEKIEDIHKVQA